MVTPFTWKNLIYHQALILEDNHDAVRLVQLILTPNDESRADFQLVSCELKTSASEDWCLHMSGTLHKSDLDETKPNLLPEFELNQLQARCPETISHEHYYAALRQYGLDYGESFQGIRQINRGERELVAEVQLPGDIDSSAYQLHPAFLDACLHVYPTLLENLTSNLSNLKSPAYLPVSLQHFRIYQKQQTRAWVHATLRSENTSPDTSAMLDIWLYDVSAQPIAAIEGLLVRRLAAESATS